MPTKVSLQCFYESRVQLIRLIRPVSVKKKITPLEEPIPFIRPKDKNLVHIQLFFRQHALKGKRAVPRRELCSQWHFSCRLATDKNPHIPCNAGVPLQLHGSIYVFHKEWKKLADLVSTANRHAADVLFQRLVVDFMTHKAPVGFAATTRSAAAALAELDDSETQNGRPSVCRDWFAGVFLSECAFSRYEV